MNRGAEHEIASLLHEIRRLVEDADPEPGQDRQRAVAATLELDALRWRLAAVVSHDSVYSERAAAQIEGPRAAPPLEWYEGN